MRSNDWKTIKSVPKDGTEVLVYGDNPLRYAIAYWSNAGNGGLVSYNPFAHRATHWQHLASPPLKESPHAQT